MFSIQCLLVTPDEQNLFVDVLGNKNVAGTPLDIYPKSGCQYNQLWNLVPSGTKNYYFIQSLLVTEAGENLVIDVQGNKNVAGTPLDLYTKKTPDAPNQLWEIVVPQTPDSASDLWYIQSKLVSTKGERLVIDIVGGKINAPGTHLCVNPNLGEYTQQLWYLAPVGDVGSNFPPHVSFPG
jgi:hypothetical protein